MTHIAILLAAFVAAGAAGAAEAPKKIYAQELVDRAVAGHPEIAEIEIHAALAKNEDSVVIAAYHGHLGQKADTEDLEVIRTGKPSTGLNKTGDRYEVNLPLLDASRRTVGGIGVAFKYKPGDDRAGLDRQAAELRDRLARHISHVANLSEKVPYDPAAVPAGTLAQKLVDDVLETNKDLVIIAVHAAAPGNAEYPIVASNIGRIGKHADEDDMSVIRTGTPKLEVNESGDRFESLGVLHDAHGKVIGAVGIVFPYKNGDDRQAMHQRAERLRGAMAAQIPSADKLVQPLP